MSTKVSAFVGRSAELAAIERRLDDAIDGSSSLVVIAGEPGIGKTRLAEEAVGLALQRGFVSAWSTAWELGGGAPFAAWAELLRTVLGDTASGLDAADRAQLSRLLPELGEPASASVGEVAQVQTFEAVARSLATLATHQPLLLVLDDLQWTDAPSRLLLEFIVTKMREARLVIATTVRDTEPGEAAETVRRLARLALRFDLSDLDRSAAVEVAVSAADGVDATTAAAIVERAGGNPFYLRELACLAAAGGLDAAGLGAVPANVRAVLDRRLARLPQETVDVLALAALVGIEFRAELLAAVLGRDVVTVVQQVEPAIAAHLCRSDSDGDRIVFAHPLVRTALVESTPPSTRMSRHLAIGEALERNPSLGSGPSEVAHHLTAAAPLAHPRRARPHHEAAATQALASTAFDKAVSHLELALGGLDPDDERGRLELLLRLGHAQRQGGLRERGRASFTKAAAIARELDDPFGLSRAALGMSEAHLDAGLGMPVPDDQAMTLVEEALRSLGSSDEAVRSRLLARQALQLRFWGDHGARADDLAEQAISIARRLGDPVLLRQVIISRAPNPYQPNDYEDEIVELLAASSDPLEVEVRETFQMFRAIAICDIDAFEQHLRVHTEAIRGFPSREWLVHLNAATLAHLRGNLSEAARHVETVLELPDARRGPMANAMAVVLLFSIRFDQGGLADLDEPVRRYLLDRAAIPAVRSRTALLLAETGHLEAARAALTELVQDGEVRMWDDMNAPIGLWQLAYVARALGDSAGAGAIHRRLMLYSAGGIRVGLSAIPGHRDQALAVTAALMGDLQAARELFESALSGADRMRAPLWRARTKADYADALVKHGVDGDQARRLAEESRDEAARYGAQGIVAQAEGVLRRLGAPSAPSSPAQTRSGAFRRDGEFWLLGFGDREVRMRDSKGLNDLAVLLARAGREVHVAELVGAADLAVPSQDVTVDETALAAYRRRLAQLGEDEEDARALGDDGRAERARAEYESLVDHLAANLGLGGRARRSDDWVERARKTVRARIGNALKRVDVQHPALGRHLRASVRTGAFCSYVPPEPVDWQL